MIGIEKQNIVHLQDSVEFSTELIGLKALFFGELHSKDIPTTHGFVITTDVFNEFLIANDLVSKINELLQTATTNLKEVAKVSGEIEKLFKDSKFPSSLEQELDNYYKTLTGGHNKVLKISPSWPPSLNETGKFVDSKYTFTNITNLDDLKRGILLSWQAVFDPQQIKLRFEQMYQGPINIALIVQRTLNAEISGRAYSYNPVNMNFDEVEIEAVLGVWRGVEELSIVPDRYVVQKETQKIVEKYTTTQSLMLLRKPVFKPSEDIDLTIKVSKPWQVRQKASDQNIKEISVLVKTIQTILREKEIEVEWVLDTGRIHVVGLRVLTQKNQSPDHKTKIPSELDTIEVIKPLDEYVEEITKEIEDLSSNNYQTSAHDIHIWGKCKFSRQTEIPKLIHTIWLDSNSVPSYEINSGTFDGIVGIEGNKLVEEWQQKFEKESIDEFIDMGVAQIKKLLDQDKNIEVMYSPSILNNEYSMKYLSSPASGLQSHFENDLLINAEFKIVKDLRDKYGFRKLSVLINGIGSVEDIVNTKKVILNVGLRRSSTFRYFIQIDSLPQFLNLKDFIKESIDGVVVNFDNVWGIMYGRKASVDTILNEKIFWNSFKEIMDLALTEKTVVFVKNNSVINSEELLNRFIKFGVNGFVFNWDNLEKGRKAISRIEIGLLGI